MLIVDCSSRTVVEVDTSLLHYKVYLDLPAHGISGSTIRNTVQSVLRMI